MTTMIALSVVHYTVCSFGMLANYALLCVIVSRTPAKMRTYGAVLFTSALVDFITTATCSVTFVKTEVSFIDVITGPCTYFNSPSFCLHLYAIALCGHSFFAYNITLCFFFRLYTIRKGTPSFRATFISLVAALLPNLINFFVLGQTEFQSTDAVKSELIRLNLTFDDSLLYFEYKDEESVINILSSLMMMIPFPIAYILIVIVFLQIRSALAAATETMSARTKQAHVEIIKGLLLQSCLPAIDACALVFYVVCQLCEITSDVAGHEMLMSIELVASLHPLISLYFVRPYRVAILKLLGRSTVTPMHSHASVTEHRSFTVHY